MTGASLKEEINTLQQAFQADLKEIKDKKDLESVRIRYIGRKGRLSTLFSQMGSLDQEQRREAGQILNAFKCQVAAAIQEYDGAFEQRTQSKSVPDTTLPGDMPPVGRTHPISRVLREIIAVFHGMGFSIAEGPEVETEYYNFEALNFQKHHPARDMQDTLYTEDGYVLRTHTSPVQVRVMENQPPPVRVIAPGRCYRRDTPDATHSSVFYQVEGLYVDEGVTFSDLKGVILAFAKRMFGTNMQVRFRPSYFPFTEPSAEYDFLCLICQGRGCKVCKGTGWLEISGAGMVNPSVFEYVGYDSERITGWAFGMGVERVAMVLYGINDIRLFYENDVRFLNQF